MLVEMANLTYTALYEHPAFNQGSENMEMLKLPEQAR